LIVNQKIHEPSRYKGRMDGAHKERWLTSDEGRLFVAIESAYADERQEDDTDLWLRWALGIWPSVPNSADNVARAPFWLAEVEQGMGHPRVSRACSAPRFFQLDLREKEQFEEARNELTVVLALAVAIAGLYFKGVREAGAPVPARRHDPKSESSWRSGFIREESYP
jgi:hypothetical protein